MGRAAIRERLSAGAAFRLSAWQTIVLRLIVVVALVAQALPLGLALGTSGEAHAEVLDDWSSGQGFDPLSLPGNVRANATVGITLTKTAPSTLYTSDPSFSYTLGIQNPGARVISGESTVSDTIPANLVLLGGNTSFPWWFRTTSGRPEFYVRPGDSDGRTSIPVGSETLELTLPLA